MKIARPRPLILANSGRVEEDVLCAGGVGADGDDAVHPALPFYVAFARVVVKRYALLVEVALLEQVVQGLDGFVVVDVVAFPAVARAIKAPRARRRQKGGGVSACHAQPHRRSTGRGCHRKWTTRHAARGWCQRGCPSPPTHTHTTSTFTDTDTHRRRRRRRRAHHARTRPSGVSFGTPPRTRSC